jgi:hydrocephalus-inducing protein
MVKDNPLPLIIPLMCTGCKPTVEITKGHETVKFDKLLLN